MSSTSNPQRLIVYVIIVVIFLLFTSNIFEMTSIFNAKSYKPIISPSITNDFMLSKDANSTSCTILRFFGPDANAGFATMIYVYTINFLLYAEHLNWFPWIDYIPEWNNKYYSPSFGQNTFNYYYEPIQPPSYCNYKSYIRNLTYLEVIPV